MRNIQNIIQRLVNESIDSQIQKNKKKQIKTIVENVIRDYINEDKEKESNSKRRAVMTALKDKKYNHAELMRKLYHPKDKSEEDTFRSLFSKKATGNPDADGAVRKFDDDEINKLYQFIRQK